MATASGVVTQVDSKDITARGRKTKTYSFQLDGKWWYRTNFEESEVEVGDQVEFKFTEDTWGKNVKPSDIKVLAKGVTAPTPTPVAAGKTAGGKGYGAFPIPALDGQRSIVRQNSLTHATALVTATLKIEPLPLSDLQDLAKLIVQLATEFEAYSCGDLEMAALEAGTKA